jgi:opacity protein-like surface antigen
MILRKNILLLFTLFSTFLAVGQQKVPFHIDSIPVKSLLTIGGYQQKKIFINRKNQYKKFDKLFWKNRDLKFDKSEITVVNKKVGQYFAVGSQLHDGTNWNHVFIVGYLASKKNKSNDFLTNDLFQADKGIALGMNYNDLKNIMKMEASVNTSKDSIRMLRYYYYDFQDYQYEYYGIPKYMIAFKFVDNKLVKFGFGNYFDFFDNDFSLEGFEYVDEIKEYMKGKYKQ